MQAGTFIVFVTAQANLILGPDEPSGEIHHVVSRAHLHDLLCLLSGWPVHRTLELAPAYWSKTSADEGVQRVLAANIFRQATFGPSDPHRTMP